MTESFSPSGRGPATVEGPARGRGGSSGAARPPIAGAVRAGVMVGGLLGALLLIVAEFTTLYNVHVATSSTPIKSVSTGSHHNYAMAVIAVAAAALSVSVYRFGSRPPVLALGALGILALLIALIGDLPDAQATGIIGSPTSHYVTASSTPSAGLYMETLGAVVLLVVSGVGFLMMGPPGRGTDGAGSAAAARAEARGSRSGGR